ncbi:MAG: ribosome biogenesis GTP-binding protein YihA/YsxC [Lachnospiraceae bacterium]|nr:ribosome biogenesis GTP-binding protein YihA/YsxC [Lachnospiraceae bacterium]
MIIKSVNLETVCGVTSKLPDNKMMEIAFAGRSNVGKSSLINALMRRKAYARVSQTPGKTQTINYYNINDSLYFVDLPGYGYAKRSKQEVSDWGNLIERYFRESKKLCLIMLLVDIRHKPNANDIQMYDWCIHYGYNPVIVATKSDKIKRSQLNKCLADIRRTLKLSDETPIVPYSSLNKNGLEDVVEYIDYVYENWSDNLNEEGK